MELGGRRHTVRQQMSQFKEKIRAWWSGSGIDYKSRLEEVRRSFDLNRFKGEDLAIDVETEQSTRRLEIGGSFEDIPARHLSAPVPGPICLFRPTIASCFTGIFTQHQQQDEECQYAKDVQRRSCFPEVRIGHGSSSL
ncbi:hypothetical protein D8B26_004357 [Coccidioides posadasii str. Silveira]|uniref:uncharacterized protein n=1 Tax=Coccidioides posadasii (strain RMSCC 757 / Silveira) TaxID=443226 RepID=UPI001BEDF023|nr:hypothetical protein D8B26_004357 [Coccidioides posadasii str. Silveira]